MPLYKELENAIESVLEKVDQKAEFKRRLRRLIENSIEANYSPEDVARILELTTVDIEEGD